MTRYIFDSDAWDCSRKLGLLDCLLAHPACIPVVLTRFVQRNELSRLEQEIDAAVAAGQIVTKTVDGADPNYKRLKRTVDKGEAESIAWLLRSEEPRVS